MDVALFLKQIGDVLEKRDTNARELDALEFEADGRDVSVRVRHQPHGSFYPPLRVILDNVGRTCLEQGLVVSELKRIAFLGDEIRVEVAGLRQRTVYRYPIKGALGPPTPVSATR